MEYIKRHVISTPKVKNINLLKMDKSLPKIIFVLGAPGMYVPQGFPTRKLGI